MCTTTIFKIFLLFYYYYFFHKPKTRSIMFIICSKFYSTFRWSDAYQIKKSQKCTSPSSLSLSRSCIILYKHKDSNLSNNIFVYSPFSFSFSLFYECNTQKVISKKEKNKTETLICMLQIQNMLCSVSFSKCFFFFLFIFLASVPMLCHAFIQGICDHTYIHT